ncbi:MAG TPA: response regulator transcription factor [Spirochaetales bacterium]|nr:response regulator transcription factor [Spirochaetales bacterium]
MRILIVEDDKKIASFIARGLEEAGFVADTVGTGEEGEELFQKTTYDAAVIDIMLPYKDGLTLVETIRAKGIRTPILILSARRSVDDRVLGLQKGGDDYLVKPFSFAELLARVQALIRRSSLSPSPSPTSLHYKDLEMNLVTREVRRSGRTIDLQPREFALLEYFLRHPGQVLTKTLIMEHVWNYDFDPQTNVVDVLVHRLRTKIDKDFDSKLIHTIRGIGYVIK